MKNLVGKFTFTVPEDAKTPDGNPHTEAGQKIEKAFDFKECETDEEAQKELTERKLSLRDLVNEKLKTNARSNAYQSAVLVYRPSEVSAEDIQARAIRDLIRLGMSEEAAKNMVLSATAKPTE